jgi:hypothetical protein
VRQYDQDHDPNIAFFFSPWCPLHITDTTMLNTDDSQAAERDWVSDVPVAPPLNPDTDTGTGTETDTAQETDTDTETEPETTRTTTPVAIRLTLTHRRVHIVRHMRY